MLNTGLLGTEVDWEGVEQQVADSVSVVEGLDTGTALEELGTGSPLEESDIEMLLKSDTAAVCSTGTEKWQAG